MAAYYVISFFLSAMMAITAFVLPIVISAIGIWRAIASTTLFRRAVWSIAALSPVIFFVGYNGTESWLEARRATQIANLERVSIKDEKFAQMVVIGWLADEEILMMSKLTGIHSFYIVEERNNVNAQTISQHPTLSTFLLSIGNDESCQAYADYLVHELIAQKRPRESQPSKPIRKRERDIKIYETDEPAPVRIPSHACVHASKLWEMASEDFPRDAIYYANGSAPPLTSGRLWSGHKVAIQVFRNGEPKLVEYEEALVPERLSMPFCFPVAGVCKKLSLDQEIPDGLALLHHALTGKDIYQ